MAEFTHTGSIDAPAAEVWATVRDFGDASWMNVDADRDGEGVGATRSISMPTGTIVEECERLDDDEMVLGYTIARGEGMPFEDYHSTIHVRPDGEGTTLVWSATYEPVGDPDAAQNVLTLIYSGGVAGLKDKLEG